MSKSMNVIGKGNTFSLRCKTELQKTVAKSAKSKAKFRQLTVNYS